MSRGFRSALTECVVLLDVLQIAKEKKYFALDPVQQDPPPQKLNVTLSSKKRVECSLYALCLYSTRFSAFPPGVVYTACSLSLFASQVHAHVLL